MTPAEAATEGGRVSRVRSWGAADPWGSAPRLREVGGGAGSSVPSRALPAALSRPVRCSDLRVESQKQRHPSGGVSVSSEMLFQLEGVELGADGKVGADAGWGQGSYVCPSRKSTQSCVSLESSKT